MKNCDAIFLDQIKNLDNIAVNKNTIDIFNNFNGWADKDYLFNSSDENMQAIVYDALAEKYDNVEVALHSSFFTPSWLVELIWSFIEKIGFTSGNAIDVGCGTGRFAPPSTLQVNYIGIDRDSIATAIARILHPDSEFITSSYQNVDIPVNAFNIFIGNLPFNGDIYIYCKNLNANHSLHTAIFYDSFRALQPGGITAVIVPRFIVDSNRFIDNLKICGASFLGAIRLPSGVFEGTEITTDLVVCQKSFSRFTVNQDYSVSNFDPECKVQVSNFWAEHPELVAGTMQLAFAPYATVKVTTTNDIRTQVAECLTRLTQMIQNHSLYDAMFPMQKVTDHKNIPAIGLPTDNTRCENEYFFNDEHQICTIKDGKQILARKNKELFSLVELKTQTLKLLDLDASDALDDVCDEQRGIVRGLYEKYCHDYGFLNRCTTGLKIDEETGSEETFYRYPTMGGFRKDPFSWSVLALENYDPQTQTGSAAAILDKRVNRPYSPPTIAASVEDGLLFSLAHRNTVDITWISQLTGHSKIEVVQSLGGKIFYDPMRKAYVPARDYLSGNVVEKLEIARRAQLFDDTYTVNVEALSKVQPSLLGREDIRVTLGASYIPVEFIKDFIDKDLGATCHIEFDPVIAVWEVNTSGTSKAEYRVEGLSTEQLLTCALNSKTPHITKRVSANNAQGFREVKDQEKIATALDIIANIHARFSEWIWEDDKRSKKIIDEYNARFNVYCTRVNNGSHLVFPGMAENISLWDHQKNFIDFALSKPCALNAHAVGGGKTKTYIALVMTLKRLGLARKPLIVVPKSILMQIGKEFYQTYPHGKFLIATEDMVRGRNKRFFAAYCAMGEWDAVVMSHETFTSIPISAQAEKDWVYSQLINLELDSLKNHGRFSSRARSRKHDALESKVKDLRGNVSDKTMVTFEQLGCDYLVIDELHYFKRLPITSNRSSLNMGASKRAFDLLLKIEWLRKCKPHAPIFSGYTGTPWTNTLAETFVWQVMFAPDALYHAGVSSFDAWASVFVRFENRIEVSADGSSFIIKERPAVIQNLPELKTMLSQFMDIVPSEHLGLERPDVVREIITVARSENIGAYMKTLTMRANQIRLGDPVSFGNMKDNMLLVCSDGRKIALDPMLKDIEEKSHKLYAVASKVAELYRANPLALQLVFCDIGTPHSMDESTYGRLKAEFIAQGIPENKIRYIHDAKTDAARATLFQQCNIPGEIAVLIASTAKAGVGVNIQKNLQALHHVDAPWRASDIEQREGRILRTGNLFKTVSIYTYVTEQSFDAFMWDALTRKARFTAQLYSVRNDVREITDFSDGVLTFAEIKAAASGNPLLVEQAALESEVKRLRMARAAFRAGLSSVDRDISLVKHKIYQLEDILDDRADTFKESERNKAYPLVIPENMGSHGWNATKTDSGEVRINWFFNHVGIAHINHKRLTKAKLAEILVAEAKSIYEDMMNGNPVIIEQLQQAKQQLEMLESSRANTVFPQEDALCEAEKRLTAIKIEIQAWVESNNQDNASDNIDAQETSDIDSACEAVAV